METLDWQRVHLELTRLARSKGAYDVEEARWLLEGKRVRVHEPLAFATFLEYMERVLGYGPRLAKEKLRVAEALQHLPVIREALATGALSWSAVRELSRVALPETDEQWKAAASGRTVREVEEMVSGRRPGDRPGDPADPSRTRHVLRLEVSGDALAAFRDARRRLELEVGRSLDDDETVSLLAHHALGGPGDPGRASYQIAMTVCKTCRTATREGAGRELRVERHHLEAAQCDAQIISLDTHVDPGPQAPATQTIPPRIRRLVWRRARGRCQVPGCRSSKHLQVHHVLPRAQGGDHNPARLALVCTAHHHQVHRGRLHIEGVAPDRLEFRHPGGAPYGCTDTELSRSSIRTPPRADPKTATDAIGALRRLGVPASDARRAVTDAARTEPDGIEELMRQALIVLGRTTYASRVSEPRTVCWSRRDFHA